MQNLIFRDLESGGDVVCLGAHCDDIEIGCGASLYTLAKRYPAVRFRLVVFCSTKEREIEARNAILALLGDRVDWSLEIGSFEDSNLPYSRPLEAKEFLISLVRGISPKLVFSHNLNDRHQDHKFVAELAYQVFRDSLILEMEIPKYEGDMAPCNVYLEQSEMAVDAKIGTIVDCYISQHEKDWFCDQTFRALMRLRGNEIKADSGYAEAFVCRKAKIA